MNDNNIPFTRAHGAGVALPQPVRRGLLGVCLVVQLALGGCLSGGGGSGGDSAASAAGSTSAASTNSPASQPPTGGGTGITATPTPGAILVGPSRAIKTIAAAAAVARDGDVIEIDAGTYTADVAVWTQRNITIRGLGGRARLDAGGTSAEGKAIFVTRGDNITIENLEFVNCHVPDQNGAGIRHETGKLVVRNSRFDSNENGILTGAGSTMTIEVYDSTFVNNGFGDGQSHNIYVGDVARFIAQGSYFSRARIGHLLKSRARENFILYNRLTDETGTASYEMEFPNGGMAWVIGNLVEQSPDTDNTSIVAYGQEGLPYSANQLFLSHNTIVNNRPAGGTFVRTVPASTTIAVNNLFVGPGSNAFGGPATLTGNTFVTAAEFVNAAAYDFTLKSTSPLRGSVAAAGAGGGYSLVPTRQYVHTPTSQAITAPSAWSPGAFQ